MSDIVDRLTAKDNLTSVISSMQCKPGKSPGNIADLMKEAAYEIELLREKTPPKEQFSLGYKAGWYAAIDAALKEAESLAGDKGTASSGLSRTFRTMAKLRKLREPHPKE
jgi:hypothetical protein